jgi:hypothetical protein
MVYGLPSLTQLAFESLFLESLLETRRNENETGLVTTCASRANNAYVRRSDLTSFKKISPVEMRCICSAPLPLHLSYL